VLRQTAGERRRRFIENGLDGLVDTARQGAPRTMTDAEVERVIAAALGQCGVGLKGVQPNVAYSGADARGNAANTTKGNVRATSGQGA